MQQISTKILLTVTVSDRRAESIFASGMRSRLAAYAIGRATCALLVSVPQYHE